MANGALITDYFSKGTGAPSTAPSVASGEYAIYQDISTGNLYAWRLNGTPGWSVIGGGGGGGGGSTDRILLQDRKSAGTHGGANTTGAWNTRDLNSEVLDTANRATLSSNQFTLLAGTYDVHICVPAYGVNAHQMRLYNVTDSVVQQNPNGYVLYGTSSMALSGDTFAVSELADRIVISASKTFRVEHRTSNVRVTAGYGASNNFGGPEIYTTVDIRVIT